MSIDVLQKYKALRFSGLLPPRRERKRREYQAYGDTPSAPENQHGTWSRNEALERGFLFWKWYGSCFHVFFWSFGSHTSIPYLFNRWVLSCFMCKLDIKISQRSFNKRPACRSKQLDIFRELFSAGSFLDAMGMFMSISAESEEQKWPLCAPGLGKTNRDLYFWK